MHGRTVKDSSTPTAVAAVVAAVVAAGLAGGGVVLALPLQDRSVAPLATPAAAARPRGPLHCRVCPTSQPRDRTLPET